MQDYVRQHVCALKSREVSKRYFAAESLADLGPSAEAAVPALIQSILEDPSIYVRKSCALALGEIGHGSATTALQKIALDDENEFVRESAADALLALGDTQ